MANPPGYFADYLDTRTGLESGEVARAIRRHANGKGLRRSVKSAGKLVVDFATGKWSSGTAPLTQGYTGYDASGALTGVASRTGMPEMLLWQPADVNVAEITLGTPGVAVPKMRTALINGNFVLIVYIENLAGFGVGETATAPTISVSMTHEVSGAVGNALGIAFNSGQLREGWNFLKFVMRNPAAYQSGSGQTEYHPFGLSATGPGTGAYSDILNNSLTGIRIQASNLNGAKLYFDSIWTGFDSDPQIVLGCDDADGSDLTNLALPLFQAKGWKGYVAVHGRYWNGSGDRVVADLTDPLTNVLPCYADGWDVVNHSMNHRTMLSFTAGQVAYEVESLRGLLNSRGIDRGAEFFVSPQSVSTRVSQKVIAEKGFVLQRHALKTNICVTPWGVDNLNSLGGTNIGGATSGGVSATTSGVSSSTGSNLGFQKFSKIQRAIDVMVAYKDTWMPFWHQITQAGDSGSGEDLTGDDLLITYSAFQKMMDYIATLETAGTLKVRDGMTGWYYGLGN